MSSTPFCFARIFAVFADKEPAGEPRLVFFRNIKWQWNISLILDDLKICIFNIKKILMNFIDNYL